MRLMATTLALIGLLGAPAALANLPSAPDPAEIPEYSGAATGDVNVEMRYGEGAKMLNRMINEQGFWGDADVNTYNKELYDEIRLKPVSDGFVPMITGESDEDIPHDVVADIVFGQMNALPAYMDGAKAVETLGYGTDSKYGLPYVDSYFILDMSFLYVVYPQRMYRKKVGDRTFLWFEKLDASFVDEATWAEYQAKIKKTQDAQSFRRLFGSIVEVKQIYGIFIVGPGAEKESRVTFVSKLIFGDDAGFLATFGSKLKPVLRGGLQSGFDASVKIAKAERDRRGS